MKHFYEIEVHFTAYDVVGITAESEEQAHEMARDMFWLSDPVISIKECATIGIDHEPLPDMEAGMCEHVTEWEE